MRESPRMRRLRSDLKALERLRAESTILDFVVAEGPPETPPEAYLVQFRGRGLWHPLGSSEVLVRELHEVSIRLGAAYPRMMPELMWKTPLFHPNVSSSGVVCLGGYATHWVPSLNLDDLCTMLWDMVRYANYDIASPYNREAATWAREQRSYVFPVDPRPLRDRFARAATAKAQHTRPIAGRSRGETGTETCIVDGEEVVEAELVENDDPDILFIE